MSRISDTFGRLKQDNRKALVCYLTACDPDYEKSLEAVFAAVEGGADILEIGVPFSDPLADGPVIQKAMTRALEHKGGLSEALRLVGDVRAKHPDIPMVLFGYLNPLLFRGMERVCKDIADAGADGVLVVDLPPEEAAPWKESLQKNGLDLISLVAPTSGTARAATIGKSATGFVYLVSMTGVTGGEVKSLEHLTPIIDAIRGASSVPVCVGFGIRDRASATRAAAICDGVVVGSAIVKSLEQAVDDGADAPSAVRALVEELRAGADT